MPMSSEMSEREGGFGGGNDTVLGAFTYNPSVSLADQQMAGFAQGGGGMAGWQGGSPSAPSYSGSGSEAEIMAMPPGLSSPMTSVPGSNAAQLKYEAAQPTLFQQLATKAMSAIAPGLSFATIPNYMTGAPETITTFNPFGLMSTFLGPMYNPFGDMLAPEWANIEIGRQPTGQPHHDPHTGRGSETGEGWVDAMMYYPQGQGSWQAMPSGFFNGAIQPHIPSSTSSGSSSLAESPNPFTPRQPQQTQPSSSTDDLSSLDAIMAAVMGKTNIRDIKTAQAEQLAAMPF